ncbi:hypothetical protein BASA61_008396 [Batrachochytrium salamandrivorans]|nr:hypothetical protein BASA61_008396 [Batrachochytrium salamandrivorans]
MTSTRDIKVQWTCQGCGEYPVTEVTQNTNGLRHTFNIDFSDHIINFPYGSELYVRVLNNDGIVSLGVRMLLDAGILITRRFLQHTHDPRSPNNGLIGPDGKLYDPEEKDEVAVFVKSWRVKDADILTNPDARKSIPPTQPGTVCRIPKDPRPKPTTAVVTTTTTTPTTATTPYSASTLPTTTSTTLPYPPVPPAPDNCNAIVPAEFYIQSCILDAQTSGSYVLSDKVKQTYLAKCRALTDDMILDPTKEATQYDPSVNQYRINVNVTIVQQQMEQHSKMPGSVPSATSIPSVPYDTPAPSVHSTPSVTNHLRPMWVICPNPLQPVHRLLKRVNQRIQNHMMTFKSLFSVLP